MIGQFLQVLAVLALVAGAAVALGNEVRLWIDDAHDRREQSRVGRHAEEALPSEVRDFVRRYNRWVTAELFADAREAFAASADTLRLARA